MYIARSNLSIDQPCKKNWQRAFSQPSWVCSSDALSGFFSFSQSNRHLQVLICEQPPRTLPSHRKGQYRVIVIDNSSTVSNSLELSLVAQLNSDVDEPVVIVLWIEALRERTMAELPVGESTIDLLKHAVAPTSLFFTTWLSIFELSLSSCNRFRVQCFFFELHLQSVFVLFFYSFFSSALFSSVNHLFSFSLSDRGCSDKWGFEGSSDKWEVISGYQVST